MARNATCDRASRTPDHDQIAMQVSRKLKLVNPLGFLFPQHHPDAQIATSSADVTPA